MKSICLCGALALLVAVVPLAAHGAAEEVGEGVYWIPIDDGPEALKGMVDNWLSFFVKRNVEKARAAGVTRIIFAIRTYGGRVDSAVEIVNTIRSCAPIETIAFVDDRAISAGALITLSCDKIYMETGSTMGAAMAITIGEDGETKAVGEKYMSFMRAVFRSVAEKRVERGASGEEEAFVAFAEAMTDPDVEVVRIDVEGVEKFVRRSILNEYARKLEKDGKKVEILEPVVEKGKLLTVTAKEAFERYRFIDGVVKDRDDLLATLGVVKPPVKAPEPSWPENLGRFLGGQFISGLLMSIAMLGLLMEVFAPGKGVGAFVFLFGIGAFFWAQYLAGQAGPFEVVFFVVGVILLAVEVFALPGFGVFGISGVGLILVGLVLAFIPAGSVSAPGLPEMPFPYDRLRVAIFTVLVALTGAAIGIALFARFLPHVPLFKHLALQPDAATVGGDIPVAGSAAPADDIARYVGSRAVAHTPLRPAGKIEIAGTYVDAVTDAEFVDAGTAVEVVEVSGNRVVVKRAGAGGAV